MRLFSLLRLGCTAAGWAAGILCAAPEPHPTRPGRLVAIRDGITVEYSPGQEALVGPFAAELAAWNRELAERVAHLTAAEPEVVPLSPRDVREHRDEILRQVSAEIGLAVPTAEQARSFDALLSDYELLEGGQRMGAALMLLLCDTREAAIWTREEVARRLKMGEPMPGFSINAASGEAVYSFTFSDAQEPRPEEREYLAELARRGLDHDFGYRTVAPGAVGLAATLRVVPGGGTNVVDEAPLPRRPMRTLAEWLKVYSSIPRIVLVLPLEADSEGKTPEALAREAVKVLRGISRNAEKRLSYREGRMVLAVLHEATESGLVDHYLGGPDRRWLCEGTANYVAWKIARDRAGVEFARDVFDLDRQIANAAGWQRQIDLRRWPTVERQSEAERNAPRNAAHYAFAMRAVHEMARRNGEDLLPKLFREIAKTPRSEVRMRTVEEAYRKLTGKKLGEVLKFAETAPAPVVVPAK